MEIQSAECPAIAALHMHQNESFNGCSIVINDSKYLEIEKAYMDWMRNLYTKHEVASPLPSNPDSMKVVLNIFETGI